MCEVAIEESVIDEEQMSEDDDAALKPSSVVRCDPTLTTAANACEKIVSDLDKIEEIASKQSIVSKNDLVKSSKSPQAGRVCDLRQFQKTRSFSAVEETSDKKVIVPEHLSAIPDFPLKDVSHSRSEQLETQPAERQSAGSGEGDDVSRRPHLEITRSETKSEACGGTPKSFEGDTLIMQFDYYSNDQPMSLQHESQYRGDSSSARSGASEHRKSGRDLTELSSDVTQHELNQIRANRMSSRPRLDTDSHSYYAHPISHSRSFLPFPLLSSIIPPTV